MVETMPDPPLGSVGPPMACDVCGVRLNNYEQWKNGQIVKITWEHTGLMPEGVEDHEPVPVLLEINQMPKVGFCDFCTSNKPEWTFPASAFQTTVAEKTNESGGTSSIGWGSEDDWAACQGCRDDIEAGRWDDVEKRYFVQRDVPKFLKAELRQDLRALHRLFRLHRKGPSYKLTKAEPHDH